MRFGHLPALFALGIAAAPVAAAPPPAEKEAIVCGLLHSCQGAAAAPRGKPRRVGATRSFSFTRPGDDAAGETGPEMDANGKLDLRISFVTGSAQVAPASRTRVRSFAAALLDPRLSAHRIRIAGHTDAMGDPAANLALSRRRADAVADLVAAQGVPRARLEVAGYGDTQPLPGHDAADAANRRVVAELAD